MRSLGKGTEEGSRRGEGVGWRASISVDNHFISAYLLITIFSHRKDSSHPISLRSQLELRNKLEEFCSHCSLSQRLPIPHESSPHPPLPPPPTVSTDSPHPPSFFLFPFSNITPHRIQSPTGHREIQTNLTILS